MGKRQFALAASGFGQALALTGNVNAQVADVFDHYKCYKIKTKEKLKGTVDLEPRQVQFFPSESGCTIKKAKKFCVPVKKTVTQLETTLTPMAFLGADLNQNMICYQIKCEKAEIVGQVVQDQFGERGFRFRKASEVCAPAGIVGDVSQAP